MSRNHLIALCAVLLPAIVSGVGIGLIMSANEEVRTLLQTPAVANGFLQCFVDQSQASFPISQQAHLHTVTDVIRSFILKSGLYPISETEALLFQTEIASSIVDIVVNEPSRQEDYAQTLATLIRILRDCYAQSTGKPTNDLAIIIETFTKLFVDVIVNVENSSSLKISAEEQRLLQTFQQVEKYGFVKGEESINGPLELALQSELEAVNKASQSTQSAFQSNVQKPTVITTSVEKPISIDTIVNLPTLPIPSDVTPSLKQSIANNNKSQNPGNIANLNTTAPGSATIKSPTDVFQNIPTDISSKTLPTPITNGNSNSAIASTIDQQNTATSGSAVSVVQKPIIASPSNLAVINSQNIQSSITSENVQTISKGNFPETPQKDLPKPRVLRSISSSNKSIPMSQSENINGIFSDFFHKEKPKTNSNSMGKIFKSSIKRLIKSGSDKFLTDIIQDAIVKENFFDPEFVTQIKQQASELLLNTITTVSMATTVPKFIGQILTKILDPQYINDFALALYDAVQGASHLENSDDWLKSFVKAFIDDVVKFLTPFASQDELDSKRKKRDNAEIFFQEVNFPESTHETDQPATVSEISSAQVFAKSVVSKNSFENNLVPAASSTFSITSSKDTSSSFGISSSVAESTATGQTAVNSINNFNVEEIPKRETILSDIANQIPNYASFTNEGNAIPGNNLISNTDPSIDTTPNIAVENNFQPSITNSFSSSFSEAVAYSGIPSDANNNESKENSEAITNAEVTLTDTTRNINSLEIENTINTEDIKVTPENSLSSSISPTSENTKEDRQPPAIVIEFASAFSKAAATSEEVTYAVDLTLHGPTADNTIYEIMFTSLSEKGKSDPTVHSRDSSHLIASNFDGMTPLVFTNALSAAVGDTILEEGLLTSEKIPTLTNYYIQILEETLDQMKVDDDPEQNSKALVIGTERFISSQGISVLHGATELASHFKEDFIYAWEDIMKSRDDNDSLFPDTKKEESKSVEVPNSKCKSDLSNSTSFAGYLITELLNSNSLSGLFFLPQLTKETAEAFYRSFYIAAICRGIEIPKPDGDIFLKTLSANLDSKSPVFFVTIYATSLEKFLCKRGVLTQDNSRTLSRLFAEILNKIPSVETIDGKSDGHFDQLINATFQFLSSLLIIKPLNPVSWTSNFLSELISTSPVSFPKLIRKLAPAILSPAGLRHPDATKRIYDLAVSLAGDVLSPGSSSINIPALAKRLEVIYNQIHTSNPALEPFGLLLGTLLEAISAIVTLINAAEMPNPNVSIGDSSALVQEIANTIP